MDQGISLNRRMARGAAWMVGLRFVDRCVGFLSTIVLARLLVPADFGLVALATALVAAVTIFGEFGFDLALIQNQKAERRHYDTAWTLGLLRGLVAAGIIMLAAEPLAAFFEDPRLESIVLVLAIAPLLESFYNIGTVAFRKELTLNKEFIFRIVPRLAGVVITITFAFAWRSYWALVVGTLAGSAMRMVMSYVMHSFRPRLSLAAWREIFGFSKWIVMTGVVDFVNRKAGVFVVGKILDAAAVGTFAIASQIANLASAELVAPVKQALFPGYAKLAHDISLLRRAFLDAYGILVAVALPTALGIGVTADYYVPLLLGPNWLDAIPLIEILVISGTLRSLTSHVRPVYLALNKPHLGAYAAVARGTAFVPALFLGITYYGLAGAAMAHAAGHAVVFLGSMVLIRYLLGVRLIDLLTACWRPLVACAAMVLVVLSLKWHPPLAGTDMLTIGALLLLVAAAGAITYVAVLLLLWRLSGMPRASAETHILSLLKRQRRRSATAA